MTNSAPNARDIVINRSDEVPGLVQIPLCAAYSLSHPPDPFSSPLCIQQLTSVVCINWAPHPLAPSISCSCCSVAKSCLTLCNPMDCSMPYSLSFTISQSLLKLMSTESVMPPNHLILCHPLLLLPSIFPSIRVFSNGLALRIRWSKY